MAADTLTRLLGTQPAQVLLFLLISALAGLLASMQARRLGLDAIPLPGLRTWRWSRLVGSLVTWLAALGLLQLAVPGLGGAGAILELLARLGLAGASVLLGSWLGHARVVMSEDADRASRESAEASRWPLLALGAGGALLALAGSATSLLVLLGVAAFLALLMSDTAPARAMGGMLRDLAAGVELRARLKPGAPVRLDGGDQVVATRPGLLTTWLSTATGARSARGNAALLAVLTAPDAGADQRSRTST